MPNVVAHRAAVARALKLIDAQEAFRLLGAPEAAEEGGTRVEIGVRPDLPFPWQAAAKSPNGILAEEPVTITFPESFPLKAPTVYLREGFDCSLAHVSPTGPGQRAVPCLVFGGIDEFHQREGIPGFLNQLKLWLEKAAFETLNDPAHGWEPTWRDPCKDLVVADAAFLRQKVDEEPRGGSAWFQLDFFEFGKRGDQPPARHVLAQLRRDQRSLNDRTLPNLFERRMNRDNPDFTVGHSLGLLVWPKAFDGQTKVVADRYTPETVVDLAGLRARAFEFGCEGKLNESLSWLERVVRPMSQTGRWPIVVVLCARRPFHLIASDSPIELCTYLLDIYTPGALPKAEATQVRPTGHRHMISTALLQQMSGLEPQGEIQRWVQLGCGSLGSKVALHLARAGWAPSDLVDSAPLAPHNAARHALLPASAVGEFIWGGMKSEALATALTSLGAGSIPHTHDVAAEINDAQARAHMLPRGAWMAVNATASLCVREALGSLPVENGAPRIVETSLYADGQIGVLTVEGPARSPNTLDLQAHVYDLVRTRPDLADRFFARGPATGRQVVGEGCGSETMVMSDARVSMFAASMAEALLTQKKKGFPVADGQILIGTLGEDRLSMGWQSHLIAPPTIVKCDGGAGWTVRVSEEANQRIQEEVARWPESETGGILVGRQSEVARAFYVTGVFPAPPDSERSASKFTLGVQDIERDLTAFRQSCGDGLYFLGTWHSHLVPSGPSGVDRSTGRLLGETRLVPSVMLIHTPSGYRALLADSISAG